MTNKGKLANKNLNNKPVLFSGIQPSGDLTLGNYLGAIKNWVALQDSNNCLFAIVDLHAITVRQDPKLFREQIYSALVLNLACGIDPEKSIVYCQSHVAAHSQLAWILNCYAYIGELNRMTQFKDKAKKYVDNINCGLFTYPVLMAADILLYGTKLVPVGDDQKQHLEIAREIATRFNNIYGAIFTVPEVYLPTLAARVMSLQDPAKKMSKSDIDKNGVIFLLDGPDVIMNKLKRAVTDSGKEIKMDPLNKPGIANLLIILATLSGKTIPELEAAYQGKGYGAFKSDVADAIIAFLSPLQKRYNELFVEKSYLNSVLRQGAIAAEERAVKLLKKVNDALGFVSF
jgi:tryptophanyl-tRNA synthetase